MGAGGKNLMKDESAPQIVGPVGWIYRRDELGESPPQFVHRRAQHELRTLILESCTVNLHHHSFTRPEARRRPVFDLVLLEGAQYLI